MAPRGDDFPEPRMAALQLCSGEDVYERVILGALPGARVSVWVATANLKDLRVPAPTGEPRYVLRIEPVSNTVVVGSRADLAVSTIRGIRPTWT
ncbi:MAG TPA: hypothetical protein PKD61_04920, partial [Polyangiaceae bacterium]|nr:hypothetical protein [Polyangiaceae bacterium]